MKKILLPLFLALFSSSLYALEFADTDRVHFFNIGAEGYRSELEQETSHNYSGFKDEGTFYGGFIKFKSYKPLGDLLASDGNTFFEFEARYAQANDVERKFKDKKTVRPPVLVLDAWDATNFDMISDYQPDYNEKREQRVWELRMTGGQKFPITSFMEIEGYFGVGYRKHIDKGESSFPDAGNIHSNMWQVPVGANLQTSAAGWRLKFNGEFIWVPLAENRSHGEYIYYPMKSAPVDFLIAANDVNNRSTGWGYKLSADLEKDFGWFGLTFTPYFKYWKISSYSEKDLWNTDGNVSIVYLEADGSHFSRSVGSQTTTEYGLQIAMLF